MIKTVTLTVIFIAFAMFFSGCNKDGKNGENLNYKEIELTQTQKNMVASGNSFAFDLLRVVNEDEQENTNLMISPLSVNLALAMTANGAKENTLDEMLEVMDFEDYNMEAFNAYFKYIMEELTELDPEVEMDIANSIWYRNDFNVLPSFLDVNKQYYDAEITALNFTSPDAVSIINDWVADATHQKIDKIIDEIPPEAVMYLINAIYFYGTWQYEFDKSQTEDKDFYLPDDETIEVPMMQMEADLKYFSAYGTSIVEIPYGRGNFVMDVILPAQDQAPENVLSTLMAATWSEWTSSLYKRPIVLSMPKFKFEWGKKDLKDVLVSLGMHDLFVDGEADLSGINDQMGLFVSRVLHKTYIDVNEEGTEAAAVTAVEVSYESAGNQPFPVNINRPFIFLIRERSTESILFSGVVNNPLLE
ncbi:MAG: serpin family protein [Bacteroidota bacterium]|nr:serpin family protein [Bacteroidota bacterium]